MRRVACILLSGVFLLTACGANDIKDVPPLTLEEVAGTRLAQLTADEREGIIYRAVSDSIMVDTSNLIAVSDKDRSAINNLLLRVEKALRGKQNEDDGGVLINEDFLNYLLLEFARTPYEWRRINIDILGFDPASRLYFVDVTYKTTGVYKDVIPKSSIPNGSENEESLKQQRYTDYINYLTLKYRGREEEAQIALEEFENRWGSLERVFAEQQGVSLADRTRAYNQDSGGLGKLTYEGLVKDSEFVNSATMVVRYVMKYNLNLGEETDLGLEALYLKSFELDNWNKILERYSGYSGVGLEVLKPFIDRLLVSYHKAVEESNDVGLNNLFADYGSIDKYYEDLRNYTYNSIDGYNFKVLSRLGRNVSVLVNRSTKIRAKGANMSLPTYNEQYIYTLVLDNDDTIRIRGVHLLKSELVGEPISLIKNVSGISEKIQYSGEAFTAENRRQVEEVLKKFAEVVFNAKVDTEAFSEVVDIGISDMALQKISSYITAIPDATRKINYIVAWNTTTNVYVSVTLREVFETASGNMDTESVVNLVNRSGEWKVIDYTRTLNVKIEDTVIDTKNALSINERK